LKKLFVKSLSIIHQLYNQSMGHFNSMRCAKNKSIWPTNTNEKELILVAHWVENKSRHVKLTGGVIKTLMFIAEQKYKMFHSEIKYVNFCTTIS